MKKNPIFWMTLIILGIAITMLVLELFVPKKVANGKVGRFRVSDDEAEVIKAETKYAEAIEIGEDFE